MTVSPPHSNILAHDPQARALWGKLRGLSFDQGTGPDTFASRLAREQGWSAGFTARAIEEYRRFLLLFALEQRREKTELTPPGQSPAVQIVPSAMVDKVWHLHLLYTQSYWDALCRDILGRPLHHQPSEGSSVETVALAGIYSANMEAYRATFGELAPGDIWPAPEGVPPPGMPLADVLGRADPSPGFGHRAHRWLVPVTVVLAPWLIFALLAGGRSPSIDGVASALKLTAAVVIGVAACVVVIAAVIAGSKTPSRRLTVNAQGETVFFCGGSDGSSGGSVCDGHSHGSHGHGESGGGHSCGGHSCGGHGCGGHGCGGH